MNQNEDENEVITQTTSFGDLHLEKLSFDNHETCLVGQNVGGLYSCYFSCSDLNSHLTGLVPVSEKCYFYLLIERGKIFSLHLTTAQVIV